MRRSAGQIIRNLESRIARLEKQARPTNIGVDKVTSRMAYIHTFSSDYLVLSVPRGSADEVKKAIAEVGGGEENPFKEKEITYKMDKLGYMNTFKVSSPKMLSIHDVVISLKLKGFFLVSHSNN
mgnify:CR=1 FL=1